MPELPEVETTVKDLSKKVLSRTFLGVWTDTEKLIKKPGYQEFVEELKGKKIVKVWRRGKNIIFDLSEGYSLLLHQKISGHLLYGIWKEDGGTWLPEKGSMEDPMNRYIHLIFFLDDGNMIALSDLRKFAKAELWKTEELKEEAFKKMGPEPLEESFTFEKFKEIISKRKQKIKQVLMNQEVIAGIGNIYADEILWETEINPFKQASELTDEELNNIYLKTKEILLKAIEVGGTSISDYRKITGEKGGFQDLRKVYRKEGQPCPRCGTKIERRKIAGRSAHFCPTCQQL